MIRHVSGAARRHPVIVIVLWLAVTAVAFTAGNGVFTRLTTTVGTTPGSQSDRTAARLDRAGLNPPSLTAVVSGRPAGDPGFRRSVQRALTEIRGHPEVTGVEDPFGERAPKARSGASVLIGVGLAPGTPKRVEHRISARLKRIDAPRVVVAGDALTDAEFTEQAQADTRKAEIIAAPLLLVLLLLVFSALLAAALPLVIAVIGVSCTFGVLLVMSLVTDVSVSAIQVTTMLSIGLAVDYSLLFVQRYREERAGGGDAGAALEGSCLSAGRTIVFSGLTVSVSLLGMLLFKDPFLRSLGVAGASVVLIDMLAAVTLLPALLALVGHRVKPAKAKPRHGRVLAAVARTVQRAPLPTLLAVGAAFAVMAAPVFGMRLVTADPHSLPASTQTRQLQDAIAADFPAAAKPAAITVVTSLPPNDPALAALGGRIAEVPGVAAVRPGPSRGGLTVVNAIPEQATNSARTRHAVEAIRAMDDPRIQGVTGDAARLADYRDALAERAPIAAGAVMLVTFLLLFAFTGSVLLPFKAVLTNVLSVGAALGIVVWVFQDGHFVSAFGLPQLAGIDLTVPVITAAIAFGLSTDYEVFLLSRAREAWLDGGDPRRAVAAGLRRSGRVILAAALLIGVAFAGFLPAGFAPVKEIGLGLLLAIALDALAMRMLLVPAAMTLLGRAAWWAPGPLRRLHRRVEITEAPAAPGLASQRS
ncbi:MMPL family transporter [Actinomadura geliboluensis]